MNSSKKIVLHYPENALTICFLAIPKSIRSRAVMPWKLFDSAPYFRIFSIVPSLPEQTKVVFVSETAAIAHSYFSLYFAA